MDAQQLKEYAGRLEDLCRAQQAEITKLRSEIERLTSELGAHGTLRSIYGDVNQPAGVRVRAAQAAIAHEVPKLLSVPPALDLVGEEIEPLAELVERRRARQRQLEGRPIEVVLSDSLPKAGNGDGK